MKPLAKFMGLLIPYAVLFLVARLVCGVAHLGVMLAQAIDEQDDRLGQYMGRLWREAKG